MHPIFHSFKRTYWSSMRFARDWALEFDLTPARFDMLIAIANDATGIAQNVLRRVLDVTSPVVSRMLQRLEELGMVLRRQHPRDRRTKWITLTEYGRGVLDTARSELLDSGFLEYELRHLLCANPSRPRVADRALRRTRVFFSWLRRRVHDASTLVYPAYLPSGERSSDHALLPNVFVHPDQLPAPALPAALLP